MVCAVLTSFIEIGCCVGLCRHSHIDRDHYFLWFLVTYSKASIPLRYSLDYYESSRPTWMVCTDARAFRLHMHFRFTFRRL